MTLMLNVYICLVVCMCVCVCLVGGGILIHEQISKDCVMVYIYKRFITL